MTYDDMKAEWYARRAVWVSEGSPDTGQSCHSFFDIDRKLSGHLWQKACDDVAAFRAAKPKHRFSQPVPPRGEKPWENMHGTPQPEGETA